MAALLQDTPSEEINMALEIGQWLEGLGLPQYNQIFIYLEIVTIGDLKDYFHPDIIDHDLQELGVKNFKQKY